MGKTPADIPFYMGYAFDRLVEDPLIEYYGYECTKGIPADDEDYNQIATTKSTTLVAQVKPILSTATPMTPSRHGP